MLYRAGAYNSAKHSIRPQAEVQKGMDLAKKLAEENKAIGITPGEDQLVKTDQRYH